MKKLLIVTHTMNIGGIERSLLGLLRSIDYSEYSVDLFLMRYEGELLTAIPQEVNVLPEIKECTCYAVPIKAVIKKCQLGMCVGRVIAKAKARAFEKRQLDSSLHSSVELEYSHKYTMRFVPKLKSGVEIYDLAISFATPHYFVRDKVVAKRKIAWIHTDYSTIEIDRESELKMWGGFDYIAGVSEKCVSGFVNKFPELEDKTMVIENILLSEAVREEALEKIDGVFDKSYINLLSVGRFDPAKNFEAVPEIVASLLGKGLKIRWYLIGFGQTESCITRNIQKFNVSDSVIILGKKENPYPYIKSCDVYVQPSKFEGKCVAVREAQILCKPVIITHYLTAESQVESGVNGYIIEQGTANIVEGLYKLLMSRDELKQVSEHCKMQDFGNKDEIKKIYRLIEGETYDS